MSRRFPAASSPVTWRDLPPASVAEALLDLSALRASYNEHLAEAARLRAYIDAAIRRLEAGAAIAQATRRRTA